MLAPDVNVLVYAHRLDSPEHAAYAAWLQRLATGAEPFALSELVLSGFLRLVTNTRVFRQPTPPARALDFVDQLCGRPTARMVRPGPKHWAIFTDLCRQTGGRGAFLADLYHAAVAIEHGCEWITADADFARVPGLRWRHPLAAPTPPR
jgi:toxin-antitoxin system PIN domain toxin